MRRRPPGSKLTEQRFPAPTLCRSGRDRAEPGAHHCRILQSVVRGAGFTLADQHAQAAIGVDHGKTALVGEVVAGEHRQAAAERRLVRSEEHTSELQSLMRISYAVFCLQKKKRNTRTACNNTR